MAAYFTEINAEQADLIEHALLFFVGTVDPTFAPGPHDIGPINLSPKGGVPLHIIGPNRIAYLDYAGSGNETARHLAAGSPITLMVCSFDSGDAAIVRLYGKATVLPVADSPLAERLLANQATEIRLPMRQVVDITVERTATSCGYGVPILELQQERTITNRGRRYKDAR